ncbi:hypothetical protein Tcan_15639 [Toxocara canis]|uniref:Uncharacterized protein n=1 Tax=Toxocara canis TaxID=6265 RepID=A0A0B2VIY1_TOXCA|nr:hypothetical protein Tcan_15639 [Toxocara canis]
MVFLIIFAMLSDCTHVLLTSIGITFVLLLSQTSFAIPVDNSANAAMQRSTATVHSETGDKLDILYSLGGYFMEFKKDVHTVIRKRQPNTLDAIVSIEAWIASVLVVLLLVWLIICCMPCLCCKFLHCVCCRSWECCDFCCPLKKETIYTIREEEWPSQTGSSASQSDRTPQHWQSYST